VRQFQFHQTSLRDKAENLLTNFFITFQIAYGSLREVETQILIAGRLTYQSQEEINHILELSAEVGRLINGLYQSLTR
jgi:four helix bundle protein